MLECSAGKFVARDAVGESEIILNPRRCPRLSTGGFTLNHNRAQPFGRTINSRGQAGRSPANDRDVVFGSARAGLKTETICNIPQFWPNDVLSVGEPRNRPIVVRACSGPKVRQLRRVGRQPGEGNLVARQKSSQVTASLVPTLTDHCDARLMWFGGDALKPSQSLPSERSDLS